MKKYKEKTRTNTIISKNMHLASWTHILVGDLWGYLTYNVPYKNDSANSTKKNVATSMLVKSSKASVYPCPVLYQSISFCIGWAIVCYRGKLLCFYMVWPEQLWILESKIMGDAKTWPIKGPWNSCRCKESNSHICEVPWNRIWVTYMVTYIWWPVVTTSVSYIRVSIEQSGRSSIPDSPPGPDSPLAHGWLCYLTSTDHLVLVVGWVPHLFIQFFSLSSVQHSILHMVYIM